MAVYKRIQKIDGYTMMSNYHLRDMNLSLKASGLLSLVLSLPADWKYSVSGLTAIVKEGKSAVMSALKELEENGYLSRMEYRENGRFQGVEYIFLEYPGQLEDIENPKGHEQIIQKMQREVAERMQEGMKEEKSTSQKTSRNEELQKLKKVHSEKQEQPEKQDEKDLQSQHLSKENPCRDFTEMENRYTKNPDPVQPYQDFTETDFPYTDFQPQIIKDIPQNGKSSNTDSPSTWAHSALSLSKQTTVLQMQQHWQSTPRLASSSTPETSKSTTHQSLVMSSTCRDSQRSERKAFWH